LGKALVALNICMGDEFSVLGSRKSVLSGDIRCSGSRDRYSTSMFGFG
jgi:hypothetical protein